MRLLPQELRFVRRGVAASDTARLAALSLSMHARARGLPALANRRTRVRVRLDTGTIALNLRTTDFVVFEVLAFGAYAIPGLFDNVLTVLDGGANIGCFALLAAQFAPEARFVCVEPNPSSLRILRENLRDNGLNATVLHAALAGADEPMLVTDEVLGHTNRARPAADGAAAGQRVAGLSVGRALDLGGLARADLFKLDIEGGEDAVFADAAGWVGRTAMLVAEIHAPLSPDAAASALAEHGLQRMALPPGPIFDNMLLMRAPR